MISLKITKFDTNEEYTAQLSAWEAAMKSSQNWGNTLRYDDPRPQPMKVNALLEVDITEEQFNAIRKAVLEQF